MSLVHDAKHLMKEAQHSLSLLLASEIPVCAFFPHGLLFSPLCPWTKPCVTHLPFYNWPSRDKDLHNGCVTLPLFIQMAFSGAEVI